MNLQPKLSIIIPAYNEAFRLPVFLESILAYFKHLDTSYEIIIVDDGSSDDTVSIAETFKIRCSTLTVIRHSRNSGKGQAIKTGMQLSRGRLRLFTDADGSTPITELPKLLQAIQNGADVAVGSRAIVSSECVITALWYRKCVGRFYRTIVYLLAIKNIRDTQCGFKLFTEHCAGLIFPRQKISGYGFDVEVLYLCNQSGFKITEVPVNWNHVPGSKVNLLKDSCSMFLDIIKIRCYKILGSYRF